MSAHIGIETFLDQKRLGAYTAGNRFCRERFLPTRFIWWQSLYFEAARITCT